MLAPFVLNGGHVLSTLITYLITTVLLVYAIAL